MGNMFFRFQILVSRFKMFRKSHTIDDYVKKILIKEAKDINVLALKNLLSYLQSHGIELNEDEP